MSWDRFLLRPWGPPAQTPADLGAEFEDLRIPTSRGNKLAAWFLPAQKRPARATYLVHTGIEGNIGRYVSLAVNGAAYDFNVLVYDWQGFGASEGIADFRNFEPDAKAVVDYLRSRPEMSAHRIVHTGVSLGALPAVAISTQTEETAGLILYGPFFPEQVPALWINQQISPLLAPLGGVAGGLWRLVLPSFMEPENYIPHLETPILVITPHDDTIIPPLEQDRFYSELPEPKQRYIALGGHTDAADTDPGLLDAIRAWSGQLPGLSTSP